MSLSNTAAANNNGFHSREIFYTLPPGAKEIKGGKFMFSAYGCALIERQTKSGIYVYTVVNPKTGETEIVSRRKLALTKSGFVDMASKISRMSIRGVSRFYVDRKPGEIERGAFLTKTANIIFTEILPKHGYAVREKQIKLAEHILDVIERRGITLAESEVGTGKTHAYLIASLLANRGRINNYWLRGHYKGQGWAESAYMPVIISTSSIALQEAIIKDYVPELSRILLECGVINTPLTAFIRKGKEHYVCEERIRRYFEDADLLTKGLIAPFIGNDAPFDLASAKSFSPHIKRSICVTDSCGKGCKYYKKCRYQAYRKKANNPAVDFQITNHNYFLADKLHRVSGRKPLLPNYQLVVIDEAHKFLAAARTMYGLELTDKELPDISQEVHTFTMDKSNSGVNVHKLAKKLREQSGKLFQRLNANIPASDEDDDVDRFPAVMDSDTVHRLKNITGITADIAKASADSQVQTIYRERRDKAVWRLTLIHERLSALRKQSKLIYWLENRVEGETETQALCSIPKDLDVRLFNDLWNDGVPTVLTSGTLSASGDFTRQKETLGLCHLPKRRLFETTMSSPFDYKNNALLYISESTPFPNNKDDNYIEAIADEIERLVTASHGHAAVLFTSYNAMGQVHSILTKRRLPFPLFRLERGGTHAIEQFKQSGNGILLASGSLWEGIDIPGNALSMLIIVRLPFQAPEPVGDYERSLCGDMETYKRRAVIPDMIIKLVQGFGRLIRKETDTGVIAILDSRANERGAYRGIVLRVLPRCRVTNSVKVIRSFMLAKKESLYFKGIVNDTRC